MTSKEIDPRLEKIYKAVSLGTVKNIILGLEKLNLVEKIPKNDWRLCGELTQDGFNQITEATFVGLRLIFEHSRINLPSYQSFDENKFSNSLIEQAGLPTIRSQSEQNEINIKFTGQQPLIKNICSYLDPQKNHSTHVKNIEINPIALIIESRNHLN